VDWSRYRNFKKSEFDCRHTGRNEMKPEFMERLQELRNLYGRPMVVSSGYRDPSHPIEARKQEPGAHSTGRACDIAIQGGEALQLMALAVHVGFTGVGVQQKGDGRYLHLDDLPHQNNRPRPWLWSY
jgi:zinc D-Ala-D-Ala carboxypeptidase